jgi:hypothetical protein
MDSFTIHATPYDLGLALEHLALVPATAHGFTRVEPLDTGLRLWSEDLDGGFACVDLRTLEAPPREMPAIGKLASSLVLRPSGVGELRVERLDANDSGTSPALRAQAPSCSASTIRDLLDAVGPFLARDAGPGSSLRIFPDGTAFATDLTPWTPVRSYYVESDDLVGVDLVVPRAATGRLRQFLAAQERPVRVGTAAGVDLVEDHDGRRLGWLRPAESHTKASLYALRCDMLAFRFSRIALSRLAQAALQLRQLVRVEVPATGDVACVSGGPVRNGWMTSIPIEVTKRELVGSVSFSMWAEELLVLLDGVRDAFPELRVVFFKGRVFLRTIDSAPGVRGYAVRFVLGEPADSPAECCAAAL